MDDKQFQEWLSKMDNLSQAQRQQAQTALLDKAELSASPEFEMDDDDRDEYGRDPDHEHYGKSEDEVAREEADPYPNGYDPDAEDYDWD